MDQLLVLTLILMLIAGFLSAIVLPVIALVVAIRTRRILNGKISRIEAALSSASGNLQPGTPVQNLQQLEARLQRIEVALAKHSLFPTVPGEAPASDAAQAAAQSTPSQPETPAQEPTIPTAPPVVAYEPPPPINLGSAAPTPTQRANQIESMIGRRWVGWVAVSLILFATAFFLKYAFDNRWIGEMGRVAVGIAFGIGMCAAGFKYHQRGWRIFSQILTAGGVVLLYVSTYAAFGYYRLVSQKVAFVYFAILIAEAAGLALLYNAPAIAIMALVGGFLTPLLLHSDQDQYRSLFAYIIALDLGALALLKHWRGLSSVAYFGTQLLFWLWYNERYHTQKRGAVLLFQIAIFLIFLAAHLVRNVLRREQATVEDLVLLLINPFIFFATAYHLLNPTHHDWMGVFAIAMGLLYAGLVKLLLDRGTNLDRVELLPMIGIALTFVTIAIPIQLRSNWITIAWAVEALAILWAGLEIRSLKLRAFGGCLLGLALAKLLVWDTPYFHRAMFTPVVNRYFLSSLVVITALFAASVLYQKVNERQARTIGIVSLLAAVVTLWFVMSVETQTFFSALADAEKLAEDAEHQRWLGQMFLSVLWAAYAATLAAAGFARRLASVRWAGLLLFALTIIKAMLVDIAQLQQLYRIIVFFVLGVLLLAVAWGYHKAFHSE